MSAQAGGAASCKAKGCAAPVIGSSIIGIGHVCRSHNLEEWGHAFRRHDPKLSAALLDEARAMQDGLDRARGRLQRDGGRQLALNVESSQLLGHASIQTTGDVYVNYENAAFAAKLADVFREDEL